MDIASLLAKRAGIRLDIGCGANKQPGFVGLDVRPLAGVDIVWDVNRHPWPLPDECVVVAMCSHLVEHIPPVAIDIDGNTWFPFVAFMDEVWRIMKVDCPFMIATPHGLSQGFRQDPTHINPCDEATWGYFDPDHPLYGIYEPRPWRIEHLTWSPTANIEVVLRKRRAER